MSTRGCATASARWSTSTASPTGCARSSRRRPSRPTSPTSTHTPGTGCGRRGSSCAGPGTNGSSTSSSSSSSRRCWWPGSARWRRSRGVACSAWSSDCRPRPARSSAARCRRRPRMPSCGARSGPRSRATSRFGRDWPPSAGCRSRTSSPHRCCPCCKLNGHERATPRRLGRHRQRALPRHDVLRHHGRPGDGVRRPRPLLRRRRAFLRYRQQLRRLDRRGRGWRERGAAWTLDARARQPRRHLPGHQGRRLARRGAGRRGDRARHRREPRTPGHRPRRPLLRPRGGPLGAAGGDRRSFRRARHRRQGAARRLQQRAGVADRACAGDSSRGRRSALPLRPAAPLLPAAAPRHRPRQAARLQPRAARLLRRPGRRAARLLRVARRRLHAWRPPAARGLRGRRRRRPPRRAARGGGGDRRHAEPGRARMAAAGHPAGDPADRGEQRGAAGREPRRARGRALRRATRAAQRLMRVAPTSDLWWKNAVVYCLDVETFHHDFDGLIDHIDHIADLGATCIWLMPFYPTPNQDDGYDISDYLGVDPRLGDLGDVPEAIRHATDRGLRVLADLVVNHTSIQHPWFQAARADADSPYRAYYVWSDDPSKEKGTTPDNWTFDDQAGRYYMHRFQPFQPDLDITNPEVRHQIAKTVGFWLQLGVSGFRMDAVPFLCETVGTDEAGSDEPRRWLHSLREFALRRRGDAMLMGEVNVEEDQLESYFEDHGDALHLQLGFLINQRLWLSLARGEAAPLEDLMRHLPVPPPDSGWATFLRNHDELTLDKLAPEERDEVFAAFAPDEDMRIYGQGIRRRAASMLGDGARARMAWSLTLSLPGTPVLLYGDEVGMVEDLSIEGRYAVRRPLDWDVVAEQRRDPESLLRFMTRLVRQRRDTPELGCGESRLLENDPPALFAHRSDWEGSTVFAIHNLSGETVEYELDLGDDVDGVDDLPELRDHKVKDGRLRLRLDAYGYLWLRAIRSS